MDGKQAIICVDDEAIILMALRQELLRHFKGRFRTETATNAERALEIIDRLYIENVRVILVLTDWLMPGLKGDEFVSIVKAAHPDVHCILISGNADSKIMEQAQLNPHLDAVIKKPWSSAQLIQAVVGCVGAA